MIPPGEEATLPLVGRTAMFRRPRGKQGFGVPKGTPNSEFGGKNGLAPDVVSPPFPPKPEAQSPKPESSSRVAVWNSVAFCVLYLMTLAPVGMALVSRQGMTTRQMGAFNDVAEASALSGLLCAMLLPVGVAARVPIVLRAFCFLPLAFGLACLGAMGASFVGPNPTPDALLRLAVGLLGPLILILVETATARRGWKFWALFVAAGAALASAYYARPL